ncbi:autotransporter outer membrane beta-barrel domain-containing protein [Campylobacter pinnipediorum]|uniref:autotransporter outer membrane beta-barrel domain-containing protein n=1 Tax=Campylobacter pinnipediorum TaxID=1965231 RepID=UPI00084D300F|nr:autotransporter outer membrane beta-barrel domain-containing protein [Campylobacter pinnipediorum]
MKISKIVSATLLSVAVGVSAYAAEGDASLSKKDLAEQIDILEKIKDNFAQELQNINGSQWNNKIKNTQLREKIVNIVGLAKKLNDRYTQIEEGGYTFKVDKAKGEVRIYKGNTISDNTPYDTINQFGEYIPHLKKNLENGKIGSNATLTTPTFETDESKAIAKLKQNIEIKALQDAIKLPIYTDLKQESINGISGNKIVKDSLVAILQAADSVLENDKSFAFSNDNMENKVGIFGSEREVIISKDSNGKSSIIVKYNNKTDKITLDEDNNLVYSDNANAKEALDTAIKKLFKEDTTDYKSPSDSTAYKIKQYIKEIEKQTNKEDDKIKESLFKITSKVQDAGDKTPIEFILSNEVLNKYKEFDRKIQSGNATSKIDALNRTFFGSLTTDAKVVDQNIETIIKKINETSGIADGTYTLTPNDTAKGNVVIKKSNNVTEIYFSKNQNTNSLDDKVIKFYLDGGILKAEAIGNSVSNTDLDANDFFGNTDSFKAQNDLLKKEVEFYNKISEKAGLSIYDGLNYSAQALVGMLFQKNNQNNYKALQKDSLSATNGKMTYQDAKAVVGQDLKTQMNKLFDNENTKKTLLGLIKSAPTTDDLETEDKLKFVEYSLGNISNSVNINEAKNKEVLVKIVKKSDTEGSISISVVEPNNHSNVLAKDVYKLKSDTEIEFDPENSDYKQGFYVSGTGSDGKIISVISLIASDNELYNGAARILLEKAKQNKKLSELYNTKVDTTKDIFTILKEISDKKTIFSHENQQNKLDKIASNFNKAKVDENIKKSAQSIEDILNYLNSEDNTLITDNKSTIFFANLLQYTVGKDSQGGYIKIGAQNEYITIRKNDTNSEVKFKIEEKTAGTSLTSIFNALTDENAQADSLRAIQNEKKINLPNRNLSRKLTEALQDKVNFDELLKLSTLSVFNGDQDTYEKIADNINGSKYTLDDANYNSIKDLLTKLAATNIEKPISIEVDVANGKKATVSITKAGIFVSQVNDANPVNDSLKLVNGKLVLETGGATPILAGLQKAEEIVTKIQTKYDEAVRAKTKEEVVNAVTADLVSKVVDPDTADEASKTLLIDASNKLAADETVEIPFSSITLGAGKIVITQGNVKLVNNAGEALATINANGVNKTELMTNGKTTIEHVLNGESIAGINSKITQLLEKLKKQKAPGEKQGENAKDEVKAPTNEKEALKTIEGITAQDAPELLKNILDSEDENTINSIEKLEAIAKAITLIPITDKTDSVTKDKINAIKAALIKGEYLAEDEDNTVKDQMKKIDELKKQLTPAEGQPALTEDKKQEINELIDAGEKELNEYKQNLGRANAVRYGVIADEAKLSAEEKAVAQGFAFLVAADPKLQNDAPKAPEGQPAPKNEEGYITDFLGMQIQNTEANPISKSKLVTTIKEISSSIKTTTDTISKVADIDVVKFNTELSTSTRLAQLTNPFNDDMALASAINKLSADSFASEGDYALSSVVKDYTDRFNYNNNIWGSVMGGTTSVKNGANPKIFGATIGYDKRLDNSIVGLTTTYAQSKADSSNVNLKGKNYQFGVYTRAYFDQSEVDAKINFNFGKNKLERTTLFGKTDAKFDSFATSFDVNYGYVYAMENNLFVKPLAGFEYSYLKTKGFTENGAVGALSFGSVKSKVAALKAGVELRKYVDNNNYFYITPGVEGEVYKDSNDMNLKFVGTNKNFKLKSDDKKNAYFTVKTGANFNLTENLSTNINFGTKLGKNKFYNGTVGVSYKFD